MKQAIIVGLVMFLGVSSVYAGTKIIKGTEIAHVDIPNGVIIISKVVDGDTTCYVSQQGKFGSHAISCVK